MSIDTPDETGIPNAIIKDDITLEDITVPKVETPEKPVRQQVQEALASYPEGREKEVVKAILEWEKHELYPRNLFREQMSDSGGSDGGSNIERSNTFMEFRYDRALFRLRFVYISKDYEDPSFRGDGRRRVPLENLPDTNVLLAIYDGKVEEIARWDE